jgi:hypothetical protein
MTRVLKLRALVDAHESRACDVGWVDPWRGSRTTRAHITAHRVATHAQLSAHRSTTRAHTETRFVARRECAPNLYLYARMNR